jgi:glycosyltransferase involved in cell wall biosynthesis
MIHRKPVITHRAVPSHPGMGVFQSQTDIVKDGITGYVVEHDSKAYAEALINLILDPQKRETMGQKGWTVAMSNFQTPIVVQKLERIYEELVHG